MQQNQGQQPGMNQEPTTPEMTDRDRVNDVLAMVKSMSTSYNIAVNEASQEPLYQTQMNILTDLHQAQRDLYQAMQAKGWYPTKPVNPQEIDQAYQKFSKHQLQFPY